MPLQLPPKTEFNIITNWSITNRREGYNLLEDNGLMDVHTKKITATNGIIELLCSNNLPFSEKLGVIPLIMESFEDSPQYVDVAYRLVLCQYAHSKLMSLNSKDSSSINYDLPKVTDLQSKLDKLKKRFHEYYSDYLKYVNYPTTTKIKGQKPTAKVSVGGEASRNHDGSIDFGVSYDPGYYSTTITSNEDLVRTLKNLESIIIEANRVYNELYDKMDFENIELTDEAVSNFAKNSSEIVKPLADKIKEIDGKKIFKKGIRKFFSFKGDWTDEETILTISKLT